MLNDLFSPEELAEAWEIIRTGFPLALWQTIYVTVLATAFSIVLGLPLGVLLVVGEPDGVRPLPRWLMTTVNWVINVLRSVPFLILMILLIPLTRAMPLVAAAFPFVARLAESSLREVNPSVVEAAQSMGASPLQIICKVMIPESVPSLLSNATIAATTILGYSAMSGIIGGGGLGKMAIDYGYYRYRYLVMILAVLLLVVLVQLIQTLGSRLAARADKRN